MNTADNSTTVKNAQNMSWAELKEFVNSISEQMKETDRLIQETNRQIQETNRRFEESRQEAEQRAKEEAQRAKEQAEQRAKEQAEQRAKEEAQRAKEEAQREREEARREKEINRMFARMDKADKELKETNKRFLSQTGHIVEGMTHRSAFRALRKAGFNIGQCIRNMVGSNKEIDMEVDLFYMDTTEAIAVEVKTYCTKAKINHFLKQMKNFKMLFPHFADLEVYVAVAAIDYSDAAIDYAREKGIIVIHLDDRIFTIDKINKIDKETLKKF